jgi:hypothetical protein
VGNPEFVAVMVRGGAIKDLDLQIGAGERVACSAPTVPVFDEPIKSNLTRIMNASFAMGRPFRFGSAMLMGKGMKRAKFNLGFETWKCAIFLITRAT